MHWLADLFHGESVAQAVVVLSLVSAIGLFIGSIRIFGITLGIAGVLFSGIAFGHFKITINPHILEFVREFGLILFVYTIGVQVGPGFFASLKRNGLPLNLMAAAIVVTGGIIAVLISVFGHVPFPAAVGLFSGATTNTPSLGAAQQVLKDLPNLAPEAIKMPGLGYAVAYPFGILGIILTMGIIRRVFRISLTDEMKAMEALAQAGSKELHAVNVEIKNSGVAGKTVREAIGREDFVISRVFSQGALKVAQPETPLALGDIVLAVGKKEVITTWAERNGSLSSTDLRQIPGEVTSRRIVITRPQILGKVPRALTLCRQYGVTITRVIRSDIEFTPSPDFRLQFADRVVVVGHPDAIDRVAKEFGNSLKSLDHPQMIPVFVGIFLGIVLGSIPVVFPGAPAPVKLGLAGGPLVVAILLSRLGHFRSLVWYMPASANLMVRELGILLFLACVGLRSGDKFVSTLTQGDGVTWMLYGAIITFVPLMLVGFFGTNWMLYGAIITFVPLMLVGFFARAVLKVNYMSICGFLSGSMTDPPALAFANQMTKSDAPSVAYATVYPLTMLLRILVAQILIFILA